MTGEIGLCTFIDNNKISDELKVSLISFESFDYVLGESAPKKQSVLFTAS